MSLVRLVDDTLFLVLFNVGEQSIHDVLSVARCSRELNNRITGEGSQLLWRSICLSRWSKKALAKSMPPKCAALLGAHLEAALKQQRGELDEASSDRSQKHVKFFIAEQASIGVVLYRSPQAEWEMIHWNLEDDVFIKGQWLRTQVTASCCDISPDGALFLYHVRPRGGDSRRGYTALSRPPFFTAGGVVEMPRWTFYGGGRFISNKEVELYQQLDYNNSPPPYTRWPTGIKSKWIELSYGNRRQNADKYKELEIGDWSFRDEKRDRIVYSLGTKLYERKGAEDNLLIDFANDSFRQVAPPKGGIKVTSDTKPIKFQFKEKKPGGHYELGTAAVKAFF